MEQADNRPPMQPEPDKIVRLHAEQILVSRKQVVGDTIRVRTHTTEHEHRIDEILTDDRVEVVRIPVGRVVDAVPDVRQEGDVTILSVVVEEIVTQRRLVLKEEVHLRRTRVARPYQETAILRRQDAIITRTAPGADEPTARTDPDNTTPTGTGP